MSQVTDIKELKANSVYWLNRPGGVVMVVSVSDVRLGDIHKAPCIDLIMVREGKPSYTSHHFLGDMGVPGAAYDSRPCQIHLTEESAEANQPKYSEWLQRVQ